jgi:cobalt/nickel transport protein
MQHGLSHFIRRTFAGMGTFLLIGLSLSASAHVQMIRPEQAIVAQGQSSIALWFALVHPFSGLSMDMPQPAEVQVTVAGQPLDLAPRMKAQRIGEKMGFTALLPVDRPGDYLLTIISDPVYKPEEFRAVRYFAKTVVNAFGLEGGWDRPVGLEAEFVPTVRPYGLWAGSLFQTIILHHGQPVPYAEVEIEYFADGRLTAPAGPFTTQIVKADKDGRVSATLPKAGWWSLICYLPTDETMKQNGKDVPIFNAPGIWVNTEAMN